MSSFIHKSRNKPFLSQLKDGKAFRTTILYKSKYHNRTLGRDVFMGKQDDRIQMKLFLSEFESHMVLKHYFKVLEERKEFLELARDS